MSMTAKIVRELKRPFTEASRLRRAIEQLRCDVAQSVNALRGELAAVKSTCETAGALGGSLEALRGELAAVRLELETTARERAHFESRVRAELLAQARSLAFYRDLVTAAPPSGRSPASGAEPTDELPPAA